MTLLRVDHLIVGYRTLPVLFDVSFEVNQAETVALLGANGAGKTTVLRALSGIIALKSGAIEFGGRRIDRLPSHHRVELGLVHVPESRMIFSTLSVEENLRAGMHVFRKDRVRVSAALERAYSFFPKLKERYHQAAGTLSGGEQQMLAIARGLAGNPRLLAIDEASFGLAPHMVEEVFQIIQGIKEHGISILLVEQNVEMSLEVADRAYVLVKGQVAFAGTSREIRRHPELVGSYLGGEGKTPKHATSSKRRQ